MGKHSDFRISSSQVVDAWRILQFQRKSLYGFCHKIIDVCMDHNLIPVQL